MSNNNPQTMKENEPLVDTLIRASALVGKCHTEHRGTPYVVVPNETKVQDLERLLPEPTRKRAHIQTEELGSFLAYVQEHQQPETAIFINENKNPMQVLAIIDYHNRGGAVAKAGWCEHRATYNVKFSDEYLRWVALNKNPLSQEAFASFLEDYKGDVFTPKGAELLEIAQSLEASKACSFKKAIKLQTGDVRLSYTEETTARAGQNGELDVPTQIKLCIPVIKGASHSTFVDVRVRYSLSEGRIRFTLEILDAVNRIKALLDEMAKEIETTLKIKPYMSAAPNV